MSDYEDRIFNRDNGIPIKSSCRLLAEVDSRNGATRREKGKRWTELRLFQTQRGAYIAQTEGNSTMEGEVCYNRVLVCENIDSVVDYFGRGWLAHELYTLAGFTVVQEVE